MSEIQPNIVNPACLSGCWMMDVIAGYEGKCVQEEKSIADARVIADRSESFRRMMTQDDAAVKERRVIAVVAGEMTEKEYKDLLESKVASRNRFTAEIDKFSILPSASNPLLPGMRIRNHINVYESEESRLQQEDIITGIRRVLSSFESQIADGDCNGPTGPKLDKITYSDGTNLDVPIPNCSRAGLNEKFAQARSRNLLSMTEYEDT